MSEDQIIELYKREREYQRCMFGHYEDEESLNLGSFLVFIRHYLEESEKGYVGPWVTPDKLPAWLKDCKELQGGSAPIQAYEHLIKVFALAGAALKTYAKIDPEKWREDIIAEGQKWIEANPSILSSLKEKSENE